MKAKTSADLSKLQTCFRVGMAAREVTCWLTEVVNIIRPGMGMEARANDLKTDGLRALQMAAKEARRVQELVPQAKKSAGVLARKAERWVKELEKPGLDISREYIKKFQERFSVISKDVAQMYSEGMKACGTNLAKENVVAYLYPELKLKK